MAPVENPYLLVAGTLIGLLVIGGAVWYVNKLFAGEIQQSLTKIIVLILVALSVLWIVDKLVFIHRNLLTPEQSNSLFDLIKSLTLLVFGYYFGTKQKEKDGSV